MGSEVIPGERRFCDYADSVISSCYIRDGGRSVDVPEDARFWLVEDPTDCQMPLLTFYRSMSRQDLKAVPPSWRGKEVMFDYKRKNKVGRVLL